jgi:RimJ/RimL family protein N-acetyltransferase
MLRGEVAGLRARRVDDVQVLHAELYDDVATRMRADSRPWRPIPPGSPSSPFALSEPSDDAAVFSVVHLPHEELAGEALLWAIDSHNRLAHIGISLLPAFRGHGLGGDVVRLLCYYGFAVRGLHRLQIETMADNAAMIAIATAAGFTREGTLRGAAWVDGEFADEAVFGLLDTEWSRHAPAEAAS